MGNAGNIERPNDLLQPGPDISRKGLPTKIVCIFRRRQNDRKHDEAPVFAHVTNGEGVRGDAN